MARSVVALFYTISFQSNNQDSICVQCIIIYPVVCPLKLELLWDIFGRRKLGYATLQRSDDGEPDTQCGGFEGTSQETRRGHLR